MPKQPFEKEIQNYLTLKNKTTATIYASAYRTFLDFYQTKHTKNTNFSHFLDQIFNEHKKPQDNNNA